MTDFQQTPPDIAMARPEDETVVDTGKMLYAFGLLIGFVAGVGIYQLVKYLW